MPERIRTWRCSSLSAYITPQQCDRNAERRTAKQPKWNLRSAEAAMIHTGDDIVYRCCEGCPGVVSLARREDGVGPKWFSEEVVR